MKASAILEKYLKLNKYGKKYYHNVPELGLVNAPRKNKQRIKLMGLDKLDFKNKLVLDLGCAGGDFCRYAIDRGASRVYGIDCKNKGSEDPIQGVQLLTKYLSKVRKNPKYLNIHYYNYDITKGLPLKFNGMKFDYIFFFSMSFHISIPKYLSEITKGVCIVEDNSKERNADIQLKKQFKMVRQVGIVQDRGEIKERGLKVFYCYN